MGDLGNLIMASEYKIDEKGYPILVGGLASIVDGQDIKSGEWYIVENGKWIWVDFTDSIFSYVIHKKGDVKKVRLENGDISYIVTDGHSNYAHGKTIKEAQEDLAYKVVAKFDGVLPESATVKDWIGIYRAVTGACSQGVKAFIATRDIDLNATLSAKEVAEITAGAFGHDKFSARVKQ